MKLHPNLVRAVQQGLIQIFVEHKQADTVVEELLLSNKKWGSRDRNFIAENIYHIVRYKKLYEYCCETEATDELSISKMINARLLIENPEMQENVLAADIVRERVLALHNEAQAIRKIRESIPDWLDETGEKALGKQWDAEINALNRRAKLSIRVNTLKTTKASVKELFEGEGIAFSDIPNAPDALAINQKKNFKSHPAYKNGWFEVQDASSQLVAPLLDAKPGMRVIDACCGAGGKTLHIAALMQNRGNIIALDTNEYKIGELTYRANRAGCQIIKASLATIEQIESLRNTADRLLLDAPCSGLGVLRRKPDAKWSLTPKFLEEIIALQKEILENYSIMLKPGGIMVYATCSILPAENSEQVKQFIETQKGNFTLLEEHNISPAETGYDGFYMAKLQKK